MLISASKDQDRVHSMAFSCTRPTVSALLSFGHTVRPSTTQCHTVVHPEPYLGKFTIPHVLSQLLKLCSVCNRFGVQLTFLISKGSHLACIVSTLA
jgi:hypothetical protein